MKRPRLVGRAALVVCLAAVALVINSYGGSTFFPELVAGFIGTLFAFVLGHWWERRREQRQLVAAAEDVKRQQETEIRRRFAAVLPELEKDSESLDVLEPGLQPNEQLFTILHPQLLEGAWSANAPRLSRLVGDFELVSDLATFYGRIDELRWRLRFAASTARPSSTR